MSEKTPAEPSTFWDSNGGYVILACTAILVLIAFIALAKLDERCSLHAEQKFVERVSNYGAINAEQYEKRGKTEALQATGILFPSEKIVSAQSQQERSDQANDTREEPEDWLWRFGCDINATDFAIAMFTLLLGAFTALLSWSTHKLWRAGEKQIGVAKITAEAANKSATAALRALAMEKARVVLDGVSLVTLGVHAVPLKRPHIVLYFRNVGRYAAATGPIRIKLARDDGPEHEKAIDLGVIAPDDPAEGQVILPKEWTNEWWSKIYDGERQINAVISFEYPTGIGQESISRTETYTYNRKARRFLRSGLATESINNQEE